jgi:curved DNA-binding protein CbpA
MLLLKKASLSRLLATRCFSTVFQYSLEKDYYLILGVSRTAGDKEIKKQFFKQAKLHHPDIALSKKQTPHEYKISQEKFKEINEAYQVLSD